MRIITGAAERNKGTSQIASTAIRLSLNKRFIILRRVMESRLAWVGIVVWVGLIFMAFTAELISPYDPTALDFGAVLSPPSPNSSAWYRRFGTRCLEQPDPRITRVVAGRLGLGWPGDSTWNSHGLLAGYWGGWADDVLMRLVDAFYAFPTLILALAITAALGPSLSNVMLAVGIVNAPAFARLVRGQVLSVRERDFVMAAYVVGVSHGRMLRYHIWPNVYCAVNRASISKYCGCHFVRGQPEFPGDGRTPSNSQLGGNAQERVWLPGAGTLVILFPRCSHLHNRPGIELPRRRFTYGTGSTFVAAREGIGSIQKVDSPKL